MVTLSKYSNMSNINEIISSLVFSYFIKLLTHFMVYALCFQLNTGSPVKVADFLSLKFQ